MSYLDRFSIQGLDGDKLQGVVIFGIAIVGFILLSFIVSAIFPAPPGEATPSKDVGIAVATSTPQSITQVAPPIITPTPTITPTVTATPRNYDGWGSGSGGSSGGKSSSHTHTPTPTPTPLPRAQLLSAVKINNSDSSLNLSIMDSLNASNNETLNNISGINVVTRSEVHNICGNETAVGCYYPDNKSIYIGDLQTFNVSTICNNFENTLYHEEGHAIYRSNHSTIDTTETEKYAENYAAIRSPDKCSTEKYKSLNNSKTVNHTIYQLAYANYSYWKMIYPALVDGISPNSIVSATDLPNVTRDYTKYVYANINYTLAVNALNAYMTSDVILTTRPNVICYPIVTYGRNKTTGEYKPFPTTCLPDGWDKVELTPTPTPSLSPSPTVNTTPTINTTVTVTPNISPTVIITPAPKLSSITVSPQDKTITIGKSQQYLAYPIDQYGNSINVAISWENSNDSVGLIDNNGLFESIKAGTTKITARSGVISGSTSITILPNNTNIDKPLISFLWITDAHCGKTNNCSGITEALQKAKNNNIKIMVDTGDLIEEQSQSLDWITLRNNITRCRDILSLNNCYYGLGDHDSEYISTSDWEGIVGHKTRYIVDDDINFPNIRLIFLNTLSDDLNQNTLDWLQLQLNTNKKVILFSHYPLINADDNFKNIIKNKVIAVFSGEKHETSNKTDRNGVKYFNQSAMRDGYYSFVDVKSNEIEITQYSINSSQKVIPPPSSPPNQDIINRVNAISIINTDPQLYPYVRNALLNTDLGTLNNITSVKITSVDEISNVCHMPAKGCYDFLEKYVEGDIYVKPSRIYVGDLNTLDYYSPIDNDGYYYPCDTFENTLYHEIGHANDLSYNSIEGDGFIEYTQHPDELYANNYANNKSPSRCYDNTFRDLLRKLFRANTSEENDITANEIYDYISQTVISTKDYNSSSLNSLEVPIPELEEIPPPPKLLFLLPELPIVPIITPNITPNITSIPEILPEVQLPPTHTIAVVGNTVSASDTNGIQTSLGTFNEVLLATATSGNRLFIKNGAYSLSQIHLPDNVFIECESNNAVIKTQGSDSIIYLNSDSAIKGCTFDGHNKPIYVKDNVVNWRIEGNNFINAKIAVHVENLTSDPLPTSGYGIITNNKGIGSKLTTLQGTRNIIVSNNVFRNLNGNTEFADFNYNVHFVTFENNSFINDFGYSIDQEMIDMVGGNSQTNSENIIRNNTIIGNFQSGIRPAKSAINNIIENNIIEYKPGGVIHEANIYLYGDTSQYSTPQYNTIRNNILKGGKYGIVLSGADNNNIYGNNISGMQYGIGLVKDTIYGANDAPKNNYVWNNNIYNVDYGIYLSNSPNNAISNNIISSWIKDIEGQKNDIPIPSTTPPIIIPENTPIPIATPITPIVISTPIPSGSCYNVPNGIPSDMRKYVGKTACISCGHHNPISSSWTPCNNPTPQPTISYTPSQPSTPIDSPTIAYFGDVEPASSSDASDLTSDLNQVIPLSPTGKVDAVFFMGDMTKSSGTFKYTLQALDASNLKDIPAFFVIGNHEADSMGSSNPLIQSKYASSVVPMNYFISDKSKNTYSIDIGNMHVININEYWDNKDGDVTTPLYDWIDSEIKPNSYNIVVGHEPLYPKSPENKADKHVGNSLDANKANRDRLQELFVSKGVDIFLAGHIHYASIQNIDSQGVYEGVTGTIGSGINQGEDKFATITYTYSNSNGLVLTQKKDIVNPKITTYNIIKSN